MKNKGALPLTWLTIQAQRTAAGTATVNWAVANETNVKNCLVAVSSDKAYYCKVKETDFDGRSNTSKTVWLDKTLQQMKFVISPNPVRQDATLNYTIPETTQATLRLINSAGAAVWQQKTMLNSSGTITIQLNHLPAGIYNLHVITSKGTQTLKVVKE